MTRARDAALFLLVATAWGGSFPAIEVGLTAFEPVAFATLRYYAAAVLVLGYVLAARTSGERVPRTRDDGIAVAAAGLLSVAGNAVFLFYGQQYTTGAVASIIYSLIPVLTAVLAALLVESGSGLDGAEAAGAGLGLVGVGLVANPSPGRFGGELVGETLLLCAVVSVAVGGVLVARADATCDSVVVTGWGLLVGAVALHATAVGLGQPLTLAAPPAPLVALAWLAVASSAVAYVVYFDLLDRVGPFQVSLVSYVVPVVATTVGWVLLGERIGPLAVGGFLLVLAGFLLVKRDAIRAELRAVGAS